MYMGKQENTQAKRKKTNKQNKRKQGVGKQESKQATCKNACIQQSKLGSILHDIRQLRKKESKQARCKYACEYERKKADKHIVTRSATEGAEKHGSELQEQQELER